MAIGYFANSYIQPEDENDQSLSNLSYPGCSKYRYRYENQELTISD